MSRRNKFLELFDFISNNGFESSLLGSIVVMVIPVLFRSTIVKWIGETGATVVVLVVLLIIQGGIFLWYRRTERICASKCGFELIERETYHIDTFVDIEECVDGKDESHAPRHGLWNEIEQWCRSAGENSRATSHVSIVSGERNLGRSTIACASVWNAVGKDRRMKTACAYRCDMASSFMADKRDKKDAQEWQERVKDWISSLAKKKYYLVILSDVKEKPWLALVREISGIASKKKKNVFFLVKLEPPSAGGPTVANGLAKQEEGSWHIEPLTAVQCGMFLREYAKRKGKMDKLGVLMQACEKADEVQSCDRWFFACSGGKPKGLITLLEYGGRALDLAISGFVESLTNAGYGVQGRQLELSFLWCLCVEKARVARAHKNGRIDVMRIVKRMKEDNFTRVDGVTKMLLRQQLSAEISVANLEEMFERASVKFPEELLVASMGVGGTVLNFQQGIATWLSSVISDGRVTDYVDVIAELIAHALQCCGAYSNWTDGVSKTFASIRKLEVAVGDLQNSDGFFRALRRNLQDRVLAECLGGLGFFEDEVIIGVVSQTLEECKEDEQDFLRYYRVALPIFGLCVCNPMSLSAVARMRQIWNRVQANAASAFPSEALPEFLGTALLCVFRLPHMVLDVRNSLLCDANNLVVLLKKMNRRVCKQVDEWGQLIDAIDQNDAWRMSGAMSAVLDKIGDDARWGGVIALFANVAVYMNDCGGCIKDFLWPRLLKALDVCRIPLDVNNRVIGLTRFPVLWRRAYHRYVRKHCSPWDIGVQLDDAKSQLEDLEKLSPSEVLRYLPELIRHFAVCVQVKQRGDAKYASALQDGWSKIQGLAEREDWFNVINRRARCWVVFWAGKILRDAMTQEEQMRYFERVRTLCDEIGPEYDVWYHVMILRTCGQIAHDPLLLRHIVDSVETLVFCRYPSILPKAKAWYVYKEWCLCAREWFHDELGRLPTKRASYEVFTTIVRVLNDFVDEPWHEDSLKDFKSLYLLRICSIEPQVGATAFLDAILADYIVDDNNRRARGAGEEDSRGFLEALFADVDVLRQLSSLSEAAMSENDMLHCFSLAQIMLCGAVRFVAPRNMNQESFVSLINHAASLSKYLTERKLFTNYMVEGFGRVCSILPPEDPWRRSLLETQDNLINAYAKNIREKMVDGSIDVMTDKARLTDLWSCPAEVLRRLPESAATSVFNLLQRVHSSYSSFWFEGMRSDWFYAAYLMLFRLPLSFCSNDLLQTIELLMFSGRFACPRFVLHRGDMVILLNRVLEERKRRGNGKLAPDKVRQYRSYWNVLRLSLYGQEDISQLHPVDQQWVKHFEVETSS